MNFKTALETDHSFKPFWIGIKQVGPAYYAQANNAKGEMVEECMSTIGKFDALGRLVSLLHLRFESITIIHIQEKT